MSTAFLFPGQGAQQIGMLHSSFLKEMDTEGLLELSSQILNTPLEELDSEVALHSTRNVQICIFIAGVISAKYAIRNGIVPSYVVGNSIGAFAAAVIAESIEFKDALELVALRGFLMEHAYPKDYGMLATIGFTTTRLNKYIETQNLGKTALEKVYLANLNTETQTVIAGKLTELNIFKESLMKNGIQSAKLLNMSVPSHCPLLHEVAVELSKAVDKIEIKGCSIPYLSNITGRINKLQATIKNDLGANVEHAVRWRDGMELLSELNTEFYLEMMPSGVLIKMVQSQYPNKLSIGIQEHNWESVLYRYKQIIK